MVDDYRPRGQGPEDVAGAAAKIALLEGWARLETQAPAGPAKLRWLADRTGETFRTVDWVRRCRNDIAHGRPLDRAALRGAIDTVTRMTAATAAPEKSGRVRRLI